MEQEAEGVTLATGSNLGPEILDVGILDECPDKRRWAAGWVAGKSP